MQSASQRLQSELTEEKAARGAALVMRNATVARHGSGYPPRLTGAVATAVVLTIVVALLVVIGVF